MNDKDYLAIKSLSKAINRHIAEMVVTRYYSTFEEAYDDAMAAIDQIAAIIYEARYKEEEDE